jgi:hypothetical protein
MDALIVEVQDCGSSADPASRQLNCKDLPAPAVQARGRQARGMRLPSLICRNHPARAVC